MPNIINNYSPTFTFMLKKTLTSLKLHKQTFLKQTLLYQVLLIKKQKDNNKNRIEAFKLIIVMKTHKMSKILGNKMIVNNQKASPRAI